jgi:hypothetical protein
MAMVMNSRICRAVAVVFCLSSFFLTTGSSSAYDYDEEISEGLPAFYYRSFRLILDKDQYVHLDLHVTGSANFYFVDADGYENFKMASAFSYYGPLSEEHTNEIDRTSQVPYAGTWYVIVDNSDGLNSLSLTGQISAYTNPLSEPVSECGGVSLAMLALIGIAVVGAVILVVIVVIVVAGRLQSGGQDKRQLRPQGNSIPGGLEYCPYCGHALRGGIMCWECGRRVDRH